MIVRLALVLLFAALLVLGASSFVAPERAATGAEVARAAREWVGTRPVQKPRRDGDEWEVDVVRSDGSLVEVTIGAELELLGLDEELGPGGSAAHDEVTGSRRLRAAAAALGAVPGGRVLGVERERSGELEVALARLDGSRVEVGLDRRLRVTEIEPERSADE